MDKYCKNCGGQLVEGDHVCRNCGAKFSEEMKRTAVAPKRSFSLKQKVMGLTAGILAVGLIGFSMWATSHHSEESVAERFQTAVMSKDAEAIISLAVHEDGTKLKLVEAEALLKLVKAEGRNVVDGLSQVVPSGKYLGIYASHKVEMIDQFAYYDGLEEGLAFQFNGKKMSEFKRTDESVTFGPMSPGIYEVEATFDGKYGETSTAASLTLANRSRDEQWIDMDLYISKVTFSIEDFDADLMKDAFVVFNKEKIPVDEYGETEEIGPFIIDGSQLVTSTVTMPWGEGTSAETAIDSTYVTVPAGIVSDEVYKKLTETMLKFSNEEPKAKASGDATAFTTITNELKEEYKDAFDYDKRNDIRYSGKFNLLAVDRNSVALVNEGKNMGVKINTQPFSEYNRSELSSPPVHKEYYGDTVMVLYYNKENDEWKVNSNDGIFYEGFEATDEFKGEETEHKSKVAPSTKPESNDAGDLELQIGAFLYEFHEKAVYAINDRDFSHVESYHTVDGKTLKESRDYLGYLESKGITEEHLGTRVEKVEQVNETTWKVTSIDEYNIIRDGASNEKKFRSVTVIKEVNGELKMDELIATEEI